MGRYRCRLPIYSVHAMTSSEKRRHPRLAMYSAALMILGDAGYLSEIKDLSQSGARVVQPKTWPGTTEQECRVYFIFDQESVIGVDMRIIHCREDDIGLEFLPGQTDRIERLLYESRFLDQKA